MVESGHRYNVIEYTNEQGKKVKSYCDLTWDARAIKEGTQCSCFGKSAKVFGESHLNLQLD